MRNYITTYDPFFNELFNIEEKSSLMKTDVKETKDEFLMKIEVPEIKRDDIKISLDDGYLKITATYNNENDNNEGEFVIKERSYGEYSRSFYVGNNVKLNDLNASLKDGVLSINIPKKEKEVTQEYLKIN